MTGTEVDEMEWEEEVYTLYVFMYMIDCSLKIIFFGRFESQWKLRDGTLQTCTFRKSAFYYLELVNVWKIVCAPLSVCNA